MILAIDPGRMKSGYALVDEESVESLPAVALSLGVVPSAEIAATWRCFADIHTPLHVLVGAGTGSAPVADALRTAGASPELVEEPFTTQQARVRYFVVHPPRGWRRLVPRGLLTPPVPVDDFAALILAENWIALRRALRTA